MALAMAAGLSGCAYQASPVDQLESPASTTDQAKAQAEAQKAADSLAPTLKRKIALGRIANDTSYGRSLLSSANPDEQTKQVYNMFARPSAAPVSSPFLSATTLKPLTAKPPATAARPNRSVPTSSSSAPLPNSAARPSASPAS